MSVEFGLEADEMSYMIGIDIGGTFTDCAIVDEDGRVFLSSCRPWA